MSYAELFTIANHDVRPKSITSIVVVVVVVVFIYFWRFQEYKKVKVSNNNSPEKGYSNKTINVMHASKQNYVYAVIVRKRHGRCTFNNKNLGSLCFKIMKKKSKLMHNYHNERFGNGPMALIRHYEFAFTLQDSLFFQRNTLQHSTEMTARFRHVKFN